MRKSHFLTENIGVPETARLWGNPALNPTKRQLYVQLKKRGFPRQAVYSGGSQFTQTRQLRILLPYFHSLNHEISVARHRRNRHKIHLR